MKKQIEKVNEIVDNPEYQGQDIYLGDSYNPSAENYNLEYDVDGDQQVDVYVGEITSEESNPNDLYQISTHPDRIHVTLKVNDQHAQKFKVDTGADTCVLTTDDLQTFPFSIDIKPPTSTLRGYSNNPIENIGITVLNISFQDKSISTKFHIVNAPGKPSILGCKQSQELDLIEVKAELNQISSSPDSSSHTSKSSASSLKGNLTEAIILEEYSDCFDKVGRFPGDKYHITLIDNPTPVIHPPRTVPVHVMPLYKEE